MSKEAYYFSHDANARHDPKILAMRSEYGIQGYGVYWIIIEMLREQDNFKLPMKEYIFNAIAMQVQCKDYAKDDAKQFVQFCINEAELFVCNDAFFWSNSLLKRMDKRNELSEKRREAAKARWQKTNDTKDLADDDDANALQMDANAMQTDARKGKERKVKESKKKEINNNTNNIVSELMSFWDQNGFGFANTNAKQKLLAYLDEGMPGDVLLKALEVAVDNNKASYSYVDKVLKNWINRGIDSVGKIEAAQLEFEKQKEQKQPRAGYANKKTTRTEFLPEWYDKPEEQPKTLDEETLAKQKALEARLAKYKKTEAAD